MEGIFVEVIDFLKDKLWLVLSVVVFKSFVPKRFYANILSCMNGCCGILSILSSFLLHSIVWAFVFIVLAVVLDLLDGVVARTCGSTPKGEIFDDIADMISFGLAVGVMVFVFGGGYVWLYGPPIYAFSVYYRLKRFVEKDKKRTDMPKGIFNGLPSPAGAVAVGSIALISCNWLVLSLAVFIFSGLMISRVKFAHFVKIMSEQVSKSRRKTKAIRFAASIVIIVILKYLIKMKGVALFGWFFLFLVVVYMIMGAITAIQAQKNFKAQTAKLA